MQSGVRIKMEYPDIVGYIVGQYFICGETKDSRISKIFHMWRNEGFKNI